MSRCAVLGSLLALGSLVLGAGCGASSGRGADGERPPNIVLLISDDHGYPDYGFMGSPRVRTPHIDALAREGVAFTHGYSTASVCQPALATLLTGLQPLQLEAWEQQARREARAGGGGRGADRPGSFEAGLATLPRLLAERGYVSLQAGKHWEGSFRDAGFDEGTVERQVSYGGEEAWHALVREGIAPVTDFVERHADRPFFVWFAPMLPHLPHDAPEPYRQMYADVEGRAAAYYAAVTWLDDGIGELVERIRALDLEEQTLFVYLADNGWDPRESEGATFALGGPKGKLSMYELGFRTPIVLRWKGVIEPRPARSELVSFTDVYATLLDYAGAPLPPQRPGHSLRPLLEQRAAWPRSDLVGWMKRIRSERSEKETRIAGSFWRDPRWRYVQVSGLPDRLFDMRADPMEERDVSAEHPEVVARAKARIEEWAREMAQPRADAGAAVAN